MSVPLPALEALAGSFDSPESITNTDIVDITFTDSTEEDANVFWYLFTAPEDGYYTFQTLGDIDTKGALYTSAKTQVSSNDDGGEGSNFLLTRVMRADDQIYLYVTRYSDSDATDISQLQITSEPVMLVDIVDYVFTGDQKDTNVFWYQFTVPEDGQYTFQTVGDLNTMGALYTNMEDEETKIASGNSSGEGSNFRITRNLYAGDQIYTRTSTYYSEDSGETQLQIIKTEMAKSSLYNNYSDDYLEYDNFLYTVEEDDSITIRGCRQSAIEVTIPETIDGRTVTIIADGAFYGCSKLTSVELADSITTIGTGGWYSNGAFEKCTALENIILPENLRVIGSSAFSGCELLTSIDIPYSVISIGSGAFEGTGIPVEEEDGISYYGDWIVATEEINKTTTDLVIRDDTRIIPDYAFSRWDNLESVTIPESVISIGRAAFGDPNTETGDDGTSGLNYLRTVTIEGNNLKIIGDNAFAGDDSLISIDLPDSVTEIGSEAFAYTSLTSIDLPENLETIGDDAFHGTNISSIILPENLTYVGAGNYSSSPVLSLVIPSTVTGISNYIMVNYWEGGDTDISNVYYLGTKQQFLDSVEPFDYYSEEMITVDPDDPIVNANVHYDCQLITEGNLTYVISDGQAVLLQCDTSAESVTIPAEIAGNPVTSIAPGAFKYCRMLKSLDIPANILEVGDDAFDNCTSLERISFPKNITLPPVVDEIRNEYGYIETSESNGVEDLFDGCSSLKEIIFDEADENYFTAEDGSVYLRNPQKLLLVSETATELNILDGTTAIAYCAVENCENITTYSGIPESVTRIGGKAFQQSGHCDRNRRVCFQFNAESGECCAPGRTGNQLPCYHKPLHYFLISCKNSVFWVKKFLPVLF
ncbi:MAG: leucine-rich repeat domain-containing protein [Oscillospiraceae bacterium]|nr:leucine-rich repeat domain-containing protein [Oscillospiraceae bacterium]